MISYLKNFYGTLLQNLDYHGQIQDKAKEAITSIKKWNNEFKEYRS